MSQISYGNSRSVARRGKNRGVRRSTLEEIDEALWAAYRKYDRSAVMEKLLQRFLGVRRSHAR